MLKSDIIWPDHRRFTSRTEWEPVGFFSESLCNSNSFDLMLGFFSSSAINVLSYGFASFLYNGGKMRLIINNILTAQDKDAIGNGLKHSIVETFDLSDIALIKETLSKRDKHFFECLSYLIQKDRLELKIIEPKDGLGISHTKVGVFYDGENRVAFDGSCNFSRTALIDNLESLTVSCDWDGYIETAKVKSIESDFERTFSGKNDSVNYLDVDSIKTSLSQNFAGKDIKSLLKEEYEILQQDSLDLPATVKTIIGKAKARVDNLISDAKKESIIHQILTPCFPFEQGRPRAYQQKAFENWKNNGQRGLFAMATGTGKTITSLNCLLEIYKYTGYYKAVILVPTITLVDQWEKECHRFHFQNIVKVFSKYSGWKSDIDNIYLQERIAGPHNNVSFIIIATYASFAKDNVFNLLNSLSKRTLLIADEAHNMGAGSIRKKMEMLYYKRRIGLSATPNRQYDTLGNESISTFFGAEKSYTFEYSMEEAIHNGVLCRYEYYPHIVRLSEEEMEEYKNLSLQIAKCCEGEELDLNNEYLERLLLKRKRIIHKAVNKISVFKEIIHQRFIEKGDLKYTLIYVPEGNLPDDTADLFVDKDYIVDDDPDKLIDAYTNIVSDIDCRITVRKFTSSTRDRDQILRDFSSGKLQVLTSMKCLDEGVDVPRSELAIFCASTGNPRQFIQRRGRILRTHPDKHLALIHDLVVIPDIDPTLESYNIERNLLKTELQRVKNFALLSENSSDTLNILDPILDYYKLSLF